MVAAFALVAIAGGFRLRGGQATMPRPAEIAGFRASCSRSSPFQVQVRALRTPFVGETLPFEVRVRNGSVAGLYKWRLFGTQDSLDFGEIRSQWVESFEAGETKVTQIEGRVVSTQPFYAVVIMESAEVGASGPFPAQHSVRLFPFDSSGGRIVTHWDPATHQPMPGSGIPSGRTQLPDGSWAMIRRGSMSGSFRRSFDEF